MLKKSGESEHPCLVPIFIRKDFSFSKFTMLTVGLSQMAFIILAYEPSHHFMANRWGNNDRLYSFGL